MIPKNNILVKAEKKMIVGKIVIAKFKSGGSIVPVSKLLNRKLVSASVKLRIFTNS